MIANDKCFFCQPQIGRKDHNQYNCGEHNRFWIGQVDQTPCTKCDRNTVSDQMRLEPPMAPPVGDICWKVTWWAVSWWGAEKGKTGSAACFQRHHAEYIIQCTDDLYRTIGSWK